MVKTNNKEYDIVEVMWIDAEASGKQGGTTSKNNWHMPKNLLLLCGVLGMRSIEMKNISPCSHL